MKSNELPLEIQNQLKEELRRRAEIKINTPYEIFVHNDKGTRFFRARRVSSPWHDTKTGNYMPFGGGSVWKIRFGKIGYRKYRDIMGEETYETIESSVLFNKSANGTIIPAELHTKAEVLDLIARIGIFNL